MTTAPKLIRAFLVAAVCIAAFAAWTPVALGQEVPPASGDAAVVDPPATTDPPADPIVGDQPADPPVVPEPPVDPPVVPEPPADPPDVVVDPPAAEQQRAASHDEDVSRWDTARDPAQPATQTPTLTPTASDAIPAAAPLPTAGAGEDFTWTEKGDAFVYGSGGSDGGDTGVVLASLKRFGSIATAAAWAPGLAHQRAARRDEQGNTGGTDLVLVDSTRNALLFFNLFGGGGGGGAALVMLTALGLLTVFRMLPPDWHTTFRNSTAVWRPSAYIPPIERPG